MNDNTTLLEGLQFHNVILHPGLPQIAEKESNQGKYLQNSTVKMNITLSCTSVF